MIFDWDVYLCDNIGRFNHRRIPAVTSFFASVFDILHQLWLVLFLAMALAAAFLAEARGNAWSQGAVLGFWVALLSSIALGFTAFIVDQGGGTGMQPEVRAFFDDLFVYGLFSRVSTSLALFDTICSIFGWFVALAATILIIVGIIFCAISLKHLFERHAPFSLRR